MKKTIYRFATLFVTIALTLGLFSSAQASPQHAAFIKRLAPGDSAGWSFDKSGTIESITATSEGWVCKAGGDAAKTHFARIKYLLPERAGKVLTTFYMKAVIVLPPDFYTQQKSSFRLMNTDNYGTTLNGAQVGAHNSSELRTAVYINSDQSLSVIANHQNASKKEFYKTSRLPVGEHTLELYGSLSEVAPWYFKIDGVVKASGTARLSPDSVPVNERVATRLMVGIDGAAGQDSNSMNLLVKSFEVADYDMSGSNPNPPTPTTIAPTATFTKTPAPTKTATVAPPSPTLPATATKTVAPTNTLLPPSPTRISVTPTATLSNSSQPTVAPGAKSLDIRVANGSSDVEERADGSMYIGSTDLELVTDSSVQTIGMRFGNVSLPKGATIVNAYIQFKADQASTTATSLTIKGEAKANAAAFGTAAKNVSSRAKTTSALVWSPPAWPTVGAQGANQRTPNLAPVIQEIINQSGWVSGNPLVIFVTGNGKRVAEAYEGDRSGAPLLHIEYIANAVPSLPTSTVVPTASPTVTAQPTQIIPPTATLEPTQPVPPTETPIPTFPPVTETVPVLPTDIVLPTETPTPTIP